MKSRGFYTLNEELSHRNEGIARLSTARYISVRNAKRHDSCRVPQ